MQQATIILTGATQIRGVEMVSNFNKQIISVQQATIILTGATQIRGVEMVSNFNKQIISQRVTAIA